MSKGNPLKGGSKGKKVLGLAALAFVAYLLFSNPAGSAGALNEGKNRLDSGANSISVFFDNLDLSGGGQ